MRHRRFALLREAAHRRQPDPLGAFGIDSAAGENHLHRPLPTDPFRQPYTATETGVDADLDLRQPQLCLRIIDRHDVVAGQRQLQPATHAGTAHQRNGDGRQHLKPAADRLPALGQSGRLANILNRRNQIEIGAGNKTVRQAALNHQPRWRISLQRAQVCL